MVWRDRDLLPESLVFKVSYLGGDMPTFALNFSRPGAQVLLQYFQFLRLGREGYREVQRRRRDVAQYLADRIGAMDAVRAVERRLRHPRVRLAAEAPATRDTWTLYDLSDRLRQNGLAGAGLPDARRPVRH